MKSHPPSRRFALSPVLDFVLVSVALLAWSISALGAERGQTYAKESEWGSTVGGLCCRLYVREHDPVKTKPVYELTLDIKNVGNKPLELPIGIAGGDRVPSLEINILEAPDILSPPSFGGAIPGSLTLKSGEVFSFRVCGPYMVGFGKVDEKSVWTRFQPEDRVYHLKATVRTADGVLISNTVALKLK